MIEFGWKLDINGVLAIIFLGDEVGESELELIYAKVDVKGVAVVKFEVFDFSGDFERVFKDLELKVKEQDRYSFSVDLLREDVSHIIEVLLKKNMVKLLSVQILSPTVTFLIHAIECVNLFYTRKYGFIFLILLVLPQFVIVLQITHNRMVLNRVIKRFKTHLAFTLNKVKRTYCEDKLKYSLLQKHQR